MNGKKNEKDFFLVIFFALIALSLNIDLQLNYRKNETWGNFGWFLSKDHAAGQLNFPANAVLHIVPSQDDGSQAIRRMCSLFVIIFKSQLQEFLLTIKKVFSDYQGKTIHLRDGFVPKRVPYVNKLEINDAEEKMS